MLVGVLNKVGCHAVGVRTGIQLCSLARDVTRSGSLATARCLCRGMEFGKTIQAQVLPWGTNRHDAQQKSRCIKFGVDIYTSALSCIILGVDDTTVFSCFL
jgi:hypothetical protein